MPKLSCIGKLGVFVSHTSLWLFLLLVLVVSRFQVWRSLHAWAQVRFGPLFILFSINQDTKDAVCPSDLERVKLIFGLSMQGTSPSYIARKLLNLPATRPISEW